jgi:acetyl esterase/lipase
MGSEDILTRSAPPPDLAIRYGSGPDQVADLRLPAVPGTGAPLVLLLHGGFWRAAYEHSAGGHLALWAASRHLLPPGAPWSAPSSRSRGVVALAAVSDLISGYRLGLGRGAVAALLGGGPDAYASRYALTSPAGLLPTGTPVRLVHGRADDTVPCEMSLDYAARARAAGDDATCEALPGAGHFEVIDPLSAAWPAVLGAFRALCPPGSGDALAGGR